MRGEYFINRESLAQIIYWMRSFTEDEFIQTFRQSRSGKAETSAPQSLHDYLENLKESGMLGFKGGRYTLLNPAKEQQTEAA